MIIYWAGGELYLVDQSKSDMSLWQGILLSAATLSVGWIAYDFLCKSPLAERPSTLMVLLFVLLVVMGYCLNLVFTGRAMMLHLGAFTATIMSANVFFVIIPNQKIVVADLIAGKEPDPALGLQAKQRSVHNNYLTLPIIFLMLSNHYPLSFATELNWVIASLVFLMGVTIRHYFNTKHARNGEPRWTWLATALLFVAIIWLSTMQSSSPKEAKNATLTAREQRFTEAEHFEDVRDLIQGRCLVCHTSEPGWEGIATAPKGVSLETDADIARRAREIYLQAGRTRAMPPPSVSRYGIELTRQERELLVKWYEGASLSL